MPVTTYTKNLSEFPGSICHAMDLANEIDTDPGITPAVDHANGGVSVSKEGTVTIVMDDAVPAPEQATFDGKPAAHTAAGVRVDFKESQKLGEGEKTITSGTFVGIDGTLTDPTSPLFKGKTPSEIIGRVTFEAKVSGDAEVKVVELEDNDASPVDMNSAPIALADTAGAWKSFQFNTDVAPRTPVAGQAGHSYCLHARVLDAPGGDQLEIRRISLSLVRVRGV